MATEDFRDYTEVDAGNDITRTEDKVDVVAMPCNVVSYVYDDKTAAHFGNFEHLFTVRLGTATVDAAHAVFWALTNGAHTIAAMAGDDDGLSLRFYRDSGPVYKMWLRDWTNDNEDGYTAAINTTYYLTVKRSGTALTCKIYDDPARGAGDLLDTLEIVCGTGTYRYVHAVASRNVANPAAITFYVEDLDLQEAVAGYAHSFGVIF